MAKAFTETRINFQAEFRGSWPPEEALKGSQTDRMLAVASKQHSQRLVTASS